MRNCDLCGGSGTPLAQKPEIHVCDNCGFLFVPVRRSPEEIAQAWSEVYSSGAYSPDWPGVKARLYYVAEWLDQNIGLDGKSVLDIGAGNGFFLDQVRQRGAHPVGLEPDAENRRKILARDIECFLGSTETVPHPGQYDLVTINWTLENSGDCLAMLRYAREALAPGGFVVVATGSRILVPFKKPLSAYLGSQPADLHCFRWSQHSLFQACRIVGLAPIDNNDWDQRDETIGVFSRVVELPASDEHDEPGKVHEFFARWEREWP